MKLKFVYEDVLLEAKKADYLGLINSGKLNQEDFDQYIFKKNKFKGPFKDSVFNDIIFRSLNKNITFSFQELKNIYDAYRTKIQEPINRDKAQLTYKIGNKEVSINELIKNETIDLNIVKEFLNYKKETKPDESFLDQVLNEAVKSSNEHLDVVHEDSNIVIFYPKTMIGSKAASRAYFENGTYYADKIVGNYGGVIGEMQWCIATDGDNRFNLYKNEKGLNVYIVVKKKLDTTGEGRFTIALEKSEDGTITLNNDRDFAASVTAGQRLVTEELIMKIIGSNLYSKVLEDVKKPNRPTKKSADVYWKNYPVEGAIRELERYLLKKDSNPDLKQAFLAKVANIFFYTKDEELLNKLYDSEDIDIYKKIQGAYYTVNPWEKIYRNGRMAFVGYLFRNVKLSEYLPLHSSTIKRNANISPMNYDEILNSTKKALRDIISPSLYSYVPEDNIADLLTSLERSDILDRLIDDQFIEMIKKEYSKDLFDHYPKLQNIVYGSSNVELKSGDYRYFNFVKDNYNKLPEKKIFNFISEAYNENFANSNKLSDSTEFDAFLGMVAISSPSVIRKLNFVNREFANEYIKEAKNHLDTLDFENYRPGWFDWPYKNLELLIEIYEKKGDTVSFLKLSRIYKKVLELFKLGHLFDETEHAEAVEKLKGEKGIADYVKSYIQQYF